MYVWAASLIAGGGLAVDSVVAVVASMLVSPIMGPVLAATFGTTINDTALIKLGLKVELLSLILCMLVGAVLGFIWMANGLYEEYDWSTREMRGRGQLKVLGEGLL